MSSRVLVADDSPTIQKVISLTLSSEPFELIQVLNEEDLMDQLSEAYDLIIYDFGLSESKNGFELTEELRSKLDKTPLFAMLGTFDNIDLGKLEKSGASDSIVKPFGSAEFVEKCNDLLSDLDKRTFPESKVEKSVRAEEESIQDDWSISSPAESDDEDFVEDLDFRSEVNDWLSPVPSVIGERKSETVLPPAIDKKSKEDETGSFELPAEFKQADPDEKSPSEEDLEYPAGSENRSTPSFDSAEELADDEDVTDPSIDINEIAQEAAKIEISKDAEEFWAIDDKLDEIEDTNPEIEFEIQPQSSEPETGSAFATHTEVTTVDEDAIVAKLIEKLAPLIQEEVKKYCEENVSKVAWEIIPDLAENIIKKEINDLSSSLD